MNDYDNNINKILEKYKIKVDEESKNFISLFLKTYNEKIQQISSTKKLNDIEEAFNKITPDKIRLKSLVYVKKLLLNKNNDENGNIFLKTVTYSLGIEIIKNIIKCVHKFEQKEINGSCVIYTFVNNKHLKKLSNFLHIMIPKNLSKNDDRTEQELIEQLKDKYKGIEKFPKNFMLILANDKVKNESKIIKKFIKYSKNFNDQDDQALEISKKYMKALFPAKKAMSSSDVTAFRLNKLLRKQVVICTLRMLLFYGFVIDQKDIIKQIKPLNRFVNNTTIGLYSNRNYNRITQIMNFLVEIDMEYLSAIFFLAICNSLTSDKALYKMIPNKYLTDWVHTQSYINYYDTSKFLKQNECSITGLNYKGNSCYMDSALICTFAIYNKSITDNILNKNLDNLKDGRRLFSICNKNLKDDIKFRKNIQKALIDITNSIRNRNTKIKNCSNFRSVIKNCPTSQAFHGTNTQDSGEFLTYLFNIFQVDVAHTSRKTYGSDTTLSPKWTLVTKQIDNKASPIVNIESTALLNVKDNYDITKFIKKTEYSELDPFNRWIPDKKNPDISYTLKKEIYKLKSSPIIIFNITRTYGEQIFDKKGDFIKIKTHNVWKKISAPEILIMKDKSLYLSGIVVHTGGAHYVANFKCNDKWYWYDDNPGGYKHIIKNIGSYEKMLNTTPSPLTHGTLFFYT